MGHLADRACPLGMLAMVAVGEIEPKGGGTGKDQFSDLFGRLRGRPDGGDNLGASLMVGLGHEPGLKRCGTYHPIGPMDLNHYQQQARSTALYPDKGRNTLYPTLGLCGEAGEVADKVKKVLRDQGGEFSPKQRAAIAMELGDVLWYLSQLAEELGYSLESIAEANLKKLADRAARGVISGNGDQR
jgi:NTP pyrophosphatase (non-canonical NTP hydrolase)